MHSSKSLRIAPASFSSAMEEYLQRMRELGAVEGPDGAVELNPSLKPVLEALHHVLSGGEVEVRVHRYGQPDIFQELQARTVQVTLEANAPHKSLGMGAVPAV
jgi:hypothetical protein